jgi:ribosomal RNA-processing protein 8
MFSEYHTGFAQQVAVWPENPVDGYVSAILTRGKLFEKRDAWAQKNKGKKAKPPPNPADLTAKKPIKPLPRGLKGTATIADLGCGVASLALTLQPHLKPLRLTLHSFDLSQPTGPAHPLVTIADIANLPLPDSSVDVAVFCLALMGTNWLDFIDEAFRILRWKGELWVAEIKSRFGRVSRGGAKVLAHSVGSQRKQPVQFGKSKGPTKAQTRDAAEASAADESQQLAVEVDGVEFDAAKAATDVGAFVEVLRKRGFVLDGEEAVDLGNRMFVKMQFVKGMAPVRGKNVKKEEEGLTGRKKMRFLEDLDKEEEDVGDEGAVLKPCVYKLR